MSLVTPIIQDFETSSRLLVTQVSTQIQESLQALLHGLNPPALALHLSSLFEKLLGQQTEQLELIVRGIV